MSRNTKFASVMTVIAMVLVGMFWALHGSRKKAGEAREDEEPERRVAASPHPTAANAVSVVTMKPQDQQQNGIRTVSLRVISRRQELQATGVVLPIQDLISLRSEYISANTQFEKARASLDVSQRQYDRLNALYKEERNASAKAVEAAQGAVQSDQAAVKAAEDTVFLDQNNIRQQWGDVVARWLLGNSSQFDRIVRQRDIFVQITLAPGAQSVAPEYVSLRTAQGQSHKARLVSPFPRLDARIQNPSFLYVTASQSGLVPGLNLDVLLPSGPPLQGVTIPADAVVWWEGKAWAYVQVSATQFFRREVPTQFPVSDGWFAPITTQDNSAFKAAEKLVVDGAQQMLSVEFRSQTQTIGESD